MSNPSDPEAPSPWQTERAGKAKTGFNDAAQGRSVSPQRETAKATETGRRDDLLKPSQWQTANKDKAKEPFNAAAAGLAQPQAQVSGKVSETVRRDRPHMAPSPQGMLRGAEIQVAYERVSRERASASKQNALSSEKAQSKKQEAASAIAKSLQKSGNLENNKDKGRQDDRGR